MNEKHREQLKALIEEILREESRNILFETETVINEFISKESLPVPGTIENRITGKPVHTHGSEFPVSHSPDQGGDEPIREKIQSLNQDKTGTVSTGSEGIYVYGITENSDAARALQLTGIDGQTVTTIPCRDLAAIVHSCPLTPYQSGDESVMKAWVLAHQNVLDIVSGQCETVIPFGFDTIIIPDGDRSAGEVFFDWISGEYDLLQTKMAKIRKKKEYGVQIFCSMPVITERITGKNDTIRALAEDMHTTGPGKAYMIRQKIEQEQKKEIESELQTIARKCHDTIDAVCDDIKVEKTRKTGEKDQLMLLNYSCLVSDDSYSQLGEVLESLEKDEGLIVRFTGPWPVYSFV